MGARGCSTRGDGRSGPTPSAGVLTVLAGVTFLAAIGCGNSTLDLTNPDLGLLGHWTFDEGVPGGAAGDSSGFGLTGLPSPNAPAPTRDVPPVRFHDSYSLSFNGQDQWIDIGNPGLLNAGGAISIAAWIRVANVEGFHNIVAHGYRTNPPYEVAFRLSSSNYQFMYWNNIDHQALAEIPQTDIGAWVHLCGVFDGSGYSIYRNGALAASVVDATTIPPNIDAPWGIGARAPMAEGADRLFQGDIDDVRIYGRALSAADVDALYRR